MLPISSKTSKSLSSLISSSLYLAHNSFSYLSLNLEISFSESELDDLLQNKMRKIEFISKDYDCYKSLSDGDKKALEYLLNAAKIINDVALEQDHPLNLHLKGCLEEAAQENSHAKKALELFNSINGVAGYNGIDQDPVQIFKDVKLLKGKNFYPEDLSVEEFHQILLKMACDGKIQEIHKILSARTMVRRKDDELTAIDYTQYFSAEFEKIAQELIKAAKVCDDADFGTYLTLYYKSSFHNTETETAEILLINIVSMR